MECEDYPYADGYYAEEQPNGSRDLLFQGFPVAGTCAVDGTIVTVCYDYINQNNAGNQAFYAVMGLVGFGANGVWNYFANGGQPGAFPEFESNSNNSGWGYKDFLDGGVVTDHDELFAINQGFAYGWTRVCHDVPINDDFAALAFGWIGGYQGGVFSSSDQVALDNVEVFVSKFDAELRIEPETLNPSSKGKWLMAVITLPECFSAEDVRDNVKINKLEFVGGSSTGTLGAANSIFADSCKVLGNGNLQCKFPRDEVIETAEGLYTKTDELKIRVRGTLYDGGPVAFSGLDVIGYKVDD
jgi:hypothetical protein